MDGGSVGRFRRRKSLQERLGLGCCGGPTWGTRPATVSLSDNDNDDDAEFDDVVQGPLQEARQEIEVTDEGQIPRECVGHLPVTAPAAPSMNLASALAAEAERQYREVQETVLVNGPSPSLSPIRPNNDAVEQPGTPLRVSLLRLLEESDGLDEKEEKSGGGDAGCDQMCCVCMGRKKGAAFIPCGHTFCRVCSRELWLNRGSCPLCIRPILEILDIF